MLEFILGILEEGLIYSIMALGVYITYKILDFPDLSVDGTFPLGAAITASLVVKGMNPVYTLFISILVGALAGAVTGIIHVVFKVRDLLSGIIVMTALYSINLRIAKKANVALFFKDSIFDNAITRKSIPEWFSDYTILTILIIIVVIVKMILDSYLKTKSGMLLRAVGDNDVLVTSVAKNKGVVKIIGLSLANAFAALAGCIYCQMHQFFDISTGTGTIVLGLASVIIGMKLFSNIKFIKPTTAVILGAIIYQTCLSTAIRMGMKASDLKLITASLFLSILTVSNATDRRTKKIKILK